VTLLRSGMAAWLQALMAGSRSAEAAPSNSFPTLPMAAVERDWVLALAAFVLSPTDRREVRHG
jgi:hypothetical protein